MTNHQEMAAADARTRIRDAALRVFARDGFKGASLRDIAQRCDVSLGMVQRQFPSKQALREACDTYVWELLQQARRNLFGTDLRSDGRTKTGTAKTGTAKSGTSRSVLTDPHAVLAPVVPYLATVLLEDEPTAMRWFDELAALHGGLLTSGDLGVALPDDADREAVVAVHTAMQLGLTVLAGQVCRWLDAPDLDASVAARIGRARLFLAAERLVAPEVAEHLHAEMDRMESTASTLPQEDQR